MSSHRSLRRIEEGARDLGLGSVSHWPYAIARIGVIVCVIVALGFGLLYFVKAVDRLGDDASGNAALNFDDREFSGGNSLVVDKGALYEARARIPEDGTYRVVTGPRVEGATELTETYIDQFARSFLIPRRPAADASWVLCYGCDLSALGRNVEVVWENGGGISLVEVVG